MKRLSLLAACAALFSMFSIADASAATVEGPGFDPATIEQIECTFLTLHAEAPEIFRSRGDVGRFGVRALEFLLGVGGHLSRPRPPSMVLTQVPISGTGFAADYTDEDVASLATVAAYYGESEQLVIANAVGVMNFLVRIGGRCAGNVLAPGIAAVPEPERVDSALEAEMTRLVQSLVVADPDPARPQYNRDSWDEGLDLDGDCQRTRHEVLIAESTIAPTMNESGCSVVSGRWVDRFDGSVYTLATEVQVDHLVALADAHRSGGWAWSTEQKRAFSNNLDLAGHLGAVGADRNSSKGDSGPASFVPPTPQGRCDYAKDYATIKAEFGLTVTQADFNGVVSQLRSCDGVGTDFSVAPLLTQVPVAEQPATPTPPTEGNCHASYYPCVIDPGFDLDCGDIGHFVWVRPGFDDPMNFDGNDNDGLGCESWPKTAPEPTWA